jgi:hypothetical protein
MPYGQIAYGAPGCRPFQQLVTVNGKQQTRYTTQCRQADGTWRVVAQSDGSSSTASAQSQVGAGALVPITPNPTGDIYGTEPDDPSFAIGSADDPDAYLYPDDSYLYPDDSYLYPYGYVGPEIALGFGYGGPGGGGYRHGRYGGFHGGYGHMAGGFHAGGGFHGGGGGGGHR